MSSSSRQRIWALALLAAVIAGLAIVQVAIAAGDLSAVQVVAERGQSEERARRDRYECHNWAVEETGIVPRRVVDAEDEAAVERGRRVERVLTGAAAGGALGGLVRATQDENSSNGVLSGAAIGAAVGALVGRKPKEAAEDPEFEEYFRALSACMEGRGYVLVIGDVT